MGNGVCRVVGGVVILDLPGECEEKGKRIGLYVGAWVRN